MEGINWRNIRGIVTSCGVETFMKAVEIWLLKPHVVNRRLSGAVVVCRTHTTCKNSAATTLRQLIKQFSTTSCELRDSFLTESIATFTEDHLHDLDLSHGKIGGRPRPKNGNLPENERVKRVFELDEQSHDVATTSPQLSDETYSSAVELYVRKLIPRITGHTRHGNTEESMNEIIMIDHVECEATFILLQREIDNWNALQTVYRLSFSSKASRISLHISENYKEPQSPSLAVTCPTVAWLQDCLLPKIAKWASKVSADAPVKSSQVLVSMEKYSALYGKLKKKYGAKFVKIWPENTDPLKFVYEDVAIATYLIVLWEQERVEKGLKSPQSFVDLGCGNGLLVHILNGEGYPGKGIDLRRRKIWDLYGPETHLEECSITPSDTFLFPDCDWLIGNHSDELTPWIPVMAARSSYSTRYFVLPCCFHDFDMKYMRTDQTKTQYRAYLDFVEEVGQVCGFQVQEDTMRIPSTKRICQIGSHRTYPREQSEDIRQLITKYITSRRAHRTATVHDKEVELAQEGTSLTSERNVSGTSASPSQGQSAGLRCGNQTHCPESDSRSSEASLVQWAPRFQPRKRTEPVRNCAKVDYNLRQRIVNEVARAILTEAGSDVSDSARDRKERKLWRKGGSLTFAEIAKLFDSDTLKNLKSECGGLKTLLKNSHQVFQVSNTSVEIRDWSASAPAQQTHSKKQKGKNSRKEDAFKTRLCWFHTCHPDGCPRLASQCQFAHGNDELRKLAVCTQPHAIHV
ncbi:probable tRNA (uracil-O(2)-)-methyltransferase [Acanthaster planci]|uniref:tRNA (uracil-O(2)-)-methyltransferase n=1 Tax=Acanthaster planci TaxID=133434 RepID=A0A8B7ZG09_ACAPL|nr:probable tRNA (uracil-O(2)-)-methyltransferase [Acanthaster planci]